MPRHEAPNHPDCFIDCPGEGFAHYTEHNGPCTTGCDPNGLAEAHARMIRAGGWEIHSSGMVRGIGARGLMRMATVLTPLAVDVERASEALKILREAAQTLGNERISTDWYDRDGVEVIESLAITTGRTSFA
jgi:hypothetical protein